jgi:hypothetical protein
VTVDRVRDRPDILERLADVCEEQGRKAVRGLEPLLGALA